MTSTKQSVRRVLAGLASLGMVGGWSAALGSLAIVSATPAEACSDQSYVGSICAFPFDYCPKNYVPADGRLLSKNEYQPLYALIGSTYGNVSGDNFAIPDLRGRMVVGTGQSVGLDNIILGQKVGQSSIVLNENQVPLRPHTHTATFVGTGGGNNTITVPASAGSLGITATLSAVQTPGVAQPRTGSLLGMGGSGNQAATIYVPSNSTATQVQLGGLDVKLTGSSGNGPIQFNVPTGITGGTVAVASAAASPSAGVSTQSPGLGVTVCIATNGLFPPRP
ncbi:tail fiber protein [Agrobacterium sp. fls2-241-TYG-188a]|uniref:phage tail protein n=1 Tax=Agrobacterium sp. fls2-241-TYG-188a TaxID=3040275 RepID=UPI00254ECC3E|nr:tail fiber protein [Agrobacterium sp. fls2-241-TYG-188a]